MPRRKERRERTDHARKTYQQRDNKKLRILVYLKSQSNGAAFNKIKSEAVGPHTQEHYHIQDIMEEMCKSEWVERIAYSERLTVYKISKLGEVVVSTALGLRANNNPIAQLDVFTGIVQES